MNVQIYLTMTPDLCHEPFHSLEKKYHFSAIIKPKLTRLALNSIEDRKLVIVTQILCVS